MGRVITPLLRSPQLALLVFGVAFGLLWHFSIIYLSPFSWMENRDHIERLFYYYVALNALLILLLSVCLFFQHRSSRWILRILLFGCGVILAARVLDWSVLYYSGDHINALFWDNAFYASGLGLIFTNVAFFAVVSFLAGMTIYIILTVSITRRQAQSRKSGMTFPAYLFLYCLLPTILVLVIGSVAIQYVFTPESKSGVYTKFPPEYDFAKSIVDYLGQGYAEPITLSDDQKVKLASMGLPLETVSAKYPFLKRSIYLDEQPHSTHPNKPLNIILIVAEGLSSYFIEDPSMRKLGITKNIERFGQETYSFNNIVNATTPTLQGQIATLASSLHVFKTTINLSKRGTHKDVKVQDNQQDSSLVTRYPFLSVILKDHLYESVHLQGGYPNFADTEHFFRFSAKYDDFISVADLQYNEQRQLEMSHWGARDIDTFHTATRWLESRQGGPFFLSISTLDIHHPYKPAVKKLGVDNDLLNSVYSTDKGFGDFWEYFKNSKYKENTILILTADHALFPTAEYLEIRKMDIGYYDKIPLMIYSPTGQLNMGSVDDVKGTQLDIAPTILELIGLDSPNAFMGLSLLSDRKNYPYLFGKVNLSTRLSANTKISWTDEEQTELIKYIRYLSSRNRLFPPPDKRMEF